MTEIYLWLFGVCFFLVLYNYILYPLLIISLSKIIKDNHIVKNVEDMKDFPTVSFIIAAYNEERVIQKKIENTLSLDYPDEKLQIIVVSDGSNDKTEEIVIKYASKGIISLHNKERKGKSAALNRAAENATGDILLFSDANNDYDVLAIKNLVRHFSDNKVGAVTGCKHIYENNDRQSSKGDGLYWRYESQIKLAESHLGSITAAEGEIFAVKSSLFNPLNPALINDDAAITFDIVRQGYRVLYDIDAAAYEEASIDLLDDFKVKVRMAAGGYQTLLLEWKTLFPPMSWFSFTFVSHKVLRWLTPHLLIVILVLSLLLSGNIYISIFALLQLVFYFLSIYGWFNRNKPDLSSIAYIPMYFTSMNVAMFFGFIRFLTKTSTVTWHKAER